MGEQFEINNNTKEIFPIFDIEWQQLRQKELFSLLENEIVKNPDIQSLWIDIFWSEDGFFDWYLSPTNRWIEHGIPWWIHKISVLQSLQSLDEDIVTLWIDAFWTQSKFYRWLLRCDEFNHYWHKYKTIPLYFPQNVLIEYLERIERWDFGVV